MENNDIVVSCKGLTKRYGNQLALNEFNMTINKGDIYGFVGENGSGKTTVIRMLSGLIKPNSGSYSLFGVDSEDKNVLESRKKIGAIVEYPSLYLNMTLKDNMYLTGLITNNNDKEEHKRLLVLVGLDDLYNSKKIVNNFSLGMKQRLAIALILLSHPEFIMLDEPMNGLDPEGIVDVRNLILNLNKEHNITFLISSHILSELGLVATKYGIISHGRMIKEVSKEELNSYIKPEVIINVNDVDKAYDLLLHDYDVYKIKDGISIIGNIELNNVLKVLQENDIEISGVNKKEGNIESYYLSLIGGNRHD